MSTTEATGTERVSVPRILADLLMVGQQHKLPDPSGMEASDGRADMSFTTRSALDAWNAVLGGSEVRSQPYKDGTLHNAHVSKGINGRGYLIALSAVTAADVRTELPVETLTVLDHIANPPPADEVSEDDAEEIRAGLNEFIARIDDEVNPNIDAAIAWALEQDEVEEYATGLSVHGPQVTLTDGAVIAWTGSLWEFEAQAKP